MLISEVRQATPELKFLAVTKDLYFDLIKGTGYITSVKYELTKHNQMFTPVMSNCNI